MPTVTYNGQSFAIDGRRLWVLGASIQYARVPPELWADRIAAARQCGCNTIATASPWLLHEPRKGRYDFEGQADVRRFIELCGEADMHVLLRVGPYVGCHFDGGGLPSWLAEQPDVVLREANEKYLERVTRYLRRLIGEVDELQATKGGPLLLVQSEHAWTCANPLQGEKYLREVTRIIRESGIAVPVINTNDLWLDSTGTIDSWRGWSDLLAHLRQFRAVRPDAPRLVSAFQCATRRTWGDEEGIAKGPHEVLQNLAQILASGSQPVLWPFHEGTSFDFLGGRLAGGPDRFVTTCAAADAPLAEDGARTDTYRTIKRLLTFANDFSPLFSDSDPDYQSIQQALPERLQTSGRAKPSQLSVVPLRGSGGRVVFVFADAPNASTTLLLEDGRHLPVQLGDQLVGWYVFDADIHGSGRLDYATLCPCAIVDREILVLSGAAGTAALLSINGAPLEATVPSGAAPQVVEHKGITVVICNQKQIDATYRDDHAVYVGASGIDADGEPLAAPGFAKATIVTAGATVEQRALKRPPPSSRKSVELTEWTAATRADHVAGTSARFASLDGPRTLASCGASVGYGWYRIRIKSGATRKIVAHAPQAADRLLMFCGGALVHMIGGGPGADPKPFDLRLRKGENELVILADNQGRFADGNDLDDPKGLFGHIYEVKAIKTIKPKQVTADPVDPFTLRGFISGRAVAQQGEPTQLQWSFTHRRHTPILMSIVDAAASGTIVLNDEPLAYYSGASGARKLHLMLDSVQIEQFKRGKNVIRFAPDPHQEDALREIRGATTFHECVDAVTASASWAFAKWEPPSAGSFVEVTRNGARAMKGAPCWWRTVVDAPRPGRRAWLDTSGLSKGQAFINGHNLGRYFTATIDGGSVGPQKELYVPEVWLEDRDNELLIFDEHGLAPHKTKLRT